MEAHLHKCIDSILNQSFVDFELLLINDGSSDKSGQICDKYAMTDSRVKVFHKANGGVSSARNVGLDNAKGKWVTFIDSDDTILSDFLSNFLSIEDADLKIQGATIIKDNQKSYINIENSCVIGHKECLDYYKKIHKECCYLTQTPWSKLFRMSIIRTNGIRFDENIRVGEDFLFNIVYILHVNKIVSKQGTGYYYLRDNSVLSTTTLTVNQEIELLNLLSPYFDNIGMTNKSVSDYFIYQKWTNIFRKSLRGNNSLKKENSKILVLFREKNYHNIANLFRFPYNIIVYTCSLPIRVQRSIIYCIFHTLNILFPRGNNEL